jgi:hypothetical protein
MGTWYWQGLIDWMRGTMAADGKIGPEDLNLFCLTDDVDEAVRYIVNADAALNAEQEAAFARAAADQQEAAAAAEREAAPAVRREGEPPAPRFDGEI